MRLTTRARFEPCPSCQALTIRALDDHVCACDVRLDPLPLDLAAEAHALLDGRRTYDIFRTAGRHEIARRDQWRIRHRRHPVLATHQCPGPIPMTALKSLPKPRRKTNERPPF